MVPGRQANRTLAIAEGKRLWRQFGFAKPRDLVLEDLAFALGVVVIEDALESSEARLVRKGSKGLIRVRLGAHNVGQKRFTIAHEIGHWCLHEKLSQLVACTSDDMVKKYKSSNAEVEANYFASELLMPESIFADLIDVEPLRFERIAELGEYFMTSLTATAIRYVDLSREYTAVVLSNNRKIQWWRGSRSFERTFWIEPGGALSPRTLAADVDGGGLVPADPQEVDLDAWVEDASAVDSDTILEETIRLGRFNQTISLLWLP